MAKYLVLIYEQEGDATRQFEPEYQQHWTFIEQHGAQIVESKALQPTSTATSLRRDGDSFAITDGPFVETKEALGGFYLLECTDLDEAIALAQQIPAPAGGVEIRPVMTFEN